MGSGVSSGGNVQSGWAVSASSGSIGSSVASGPDAKVELRKSSVAAIVVLIHSCGTRTRTRIDGARTAATAPRFGERRDASTAAAIRHAAKRMLRIARIGSTPGVTANARIAVEPATGIHPEQAGQEQEPRDHEDRGGTPAPEQRVSGAGQEQPEEAGDRESTHGGR